jgi:hypothetical protein
MQGDSPDAVFVEMLMNLEQITLVVEFQSQRLTQRRQALASNDDHRTIDLGDDANGFIIAGALARGRGVRGLIGRGLCDGEVSIHHRMVP